MITKLEEVNLNNPSIYGQEIVWLKQIMDHGLHVADSVIISNNIFKKYLDNKYIDKNDIEAIFKLINPQYNNSHESIFITDVTQ